MIALGEHNGERPLRDQPGRCPADRPHADEGHVPMSTAVRRIAVVVLVTHGVIHLLGAAKGLGWAEVTRLQEPISTAVGVAWLTAATLILVAAVLLAGAAR